MEPRWYSVFANLTVAALTSLVVASEARGGPNGFICYKTTLPLDAATAIDLSARYGTAYDAKGGRLLCARAEQYGDGVGTDLTSYRITAPRAQQTLVHAVNQFGEQFFDMKEVSDLLIPTNVTLASEPAPVPPDETVMVDHYRCVKIKTSDGSKKLPKGLTAVVTDPFGARTVSIKSASGLCVATEKDGQEVTDANAHLVCYRVKPSKKTRTTGVQIANELHTAVLDLKKERELCVPSAMDRMCGDGSVAQPGEPCDYGPVYDTIRTEASKLVPGPEGLPLPLAASWNAYYMPDEPDSSWRPENQMKLIDEGHFWLPSINHPVGNYQVDEPIDYNDYTRGFWKYYEVAVKRAAALHLPLVLMTSQWERWLSEAPYLGLPPAQNPNVVLANGEIQKKLSPFGPVQPWHDIGKLHTNNERMKMLQEWYPDPPRVIFLSNNEASLLWWVEVEQEPRYLALYGSGRTPDFKRKVVAEGWIERYRAMQEGMREGLLNQKWKDAATFIGYGALGPSHFARWGGWPEYSLYSAGRIDPSPLMWDGGSPAYYTFDWDGSTDYTMWSPQIESMNWVFMQEEARALNPEFWLELSVWDGAQGGPTDKRAFYASQGQTYTPERYKGWMQFGMWLLRPRAVREYRNGGEPWAPNQPYFMTIVDAVDRVHRDERLKAWWRQGTLVANRAHQHPYQESVPSEYADRDRWFLLDANVNKQTFPWIWSDEIKVFALALVRGTAPNREWLVYAHSPLRKRDDVALTIPDFRNIKVDVAVDGSFYEVSEADGAVSEISPRG